MGVRGLVPTMGALHEGHLSLVRQALRECDEVVVTIFVNPSQFGPNEDFAAYPRTVDQDLALLQALDGAERLRIEQPSVADLYPNGVEGSTRVVVPDLSDILCGATRPDFLVGAASVVLRLLNKYRPDRAYFGEKDYQQLMVIQRMVSDLLLSIKVVGCPILREASGLAMSSRNEYLTPADRDKAAEIYEVLNRVSRDFGSRIKSGMTSIQATVIPDSSLAVIPDSSLAVIPDPDLESIITTTTRDLTSRGFLVDYVAIKWGRILVAAQLNGVRLIDNVAIQPQ